MARFKLLAAFAVAVPAIALAQVGPNPAVKNGSQDPTVGRGTDAATAPEDSGPSADTVLRQDAAVNSSKTNDASSAMNASDAATNASETKPTGAPTTGSKRNHKPR